MDANGQSAYVAESRNRVGHHSLYDRLTGLPNRDLFLDRLDRCIQRSHRAGGPVAVIFADLDSFKSVNETYGHRIGDELLTGVAGRLRRLLRSGDTVARLVGDEFVILCEDLRRVSHVAPIAARVDAGLNEPFGLPTTEIEVSASVGIAFARGGGEIPEQILEEANIAMSAMKRTSRVTHPVFHLRALQPDQVASAIG
jgi:diguanylate cyclase (GGDEF)-like protein